MTQILIFVSNNILHITPGHNIDVSRLLSRTMQCPGSIHLARHFIDFKFGMKQRVYTMKGVIKHGIVIIDETDDSIRLSFKQGIVRLPSVRIKL